VKTLRLSATLAALILTASTAGAAVTDFGNALGPSGGYTSQAYYRAMLGGQAMTAAQQAYADQEDHLRQLGFQPELGGDFALGQMLFHVAYGMAQPSALALVGGGNSHGHSGPSPAGGSPSTNEEGSVFTLVTVPDLGGLPVIAVPEPSTWAMMLLGFGGLGYAGWRASRKAALRAA
jgi:PEP-CTERM motif